MSELRDRIAAALKAQAEFRGIYKIADFDYPFLADAVIAELGLWQQWSNWHEGYYRYVTDWKADNEAHR